MATHIFSLARSHVTFDETAERKERMAGNSSDSGRSVTSKVIAILLTFTNGNAYSLTEIARLNGLPISTAHRLATELAAWGILERTNDAHYRAGAQLKVIGSVAAHVPGLQERARRVMEDLADAIHAHVRLGVLKDLDVAFLEKAPGNRPVSTFCATPRVPVHATAMGKALLAFSSPSTVETIISRGLERYTPFTLTTPERLRHSLSVTRLTRVAVARRELDLETAAMAVPVFGPGGSVLAALELAVRDPKRDLLPLQPALLVAARSLSRELSTSRTWGELKIVSQNDNGALAPARTATATAMATVPTNGRALA
jgi:DNA-binding IclR family transcriptional regulator